MSDEQYVQKYDVLIEVRDDGLANYSLTFSDEGGEAIERTGSQCSLDFVFRTVAMHVRDAKAMKQ